MVDEHPAAPPAASSPDAGPPAQPEAPPPRLGETDLRGGGWRWPRFGMRTLLLVVLLAAASVVGTAWRAIHQRRQQAVLETLAPYGVQAGWLGGDVAQVTFRGAAFRDEALRHLSGLPALRRLVLIDTDVTAAGVAGLEDLPLQELKIVRAPKLTAEAGPALARLSSLESLWLEHTAADDGILEHVARLPLLESLSLVGTPVSDAGLEALRGAKLKQVYLQQTRVTRDGAEELARQIPQAEVAF